ncbi:hypothetical protein PMZ80_005674 [Knufia obscura]|uniref:Uncharacterized protein n=2 Tax=Knufia TaxID=430999 RepID=A0AAN8I4R1_9EURO|nr:hypothetical protein PMZ80_005674 [Knufia obscura]KAK5949431.1 hypothetical protein OHC33_009605 [Knufia fluminis]
MSTLGMGFSVEHDPDVRAYKALRSRLLAKEREGRDAARAARAEELKRTGARPEGRSLAEKIRVFASGRRRKAVSVGGVVVDAKKLEEDSDFED